MKQQFIAEIQHNTYRKGEWCVTTDDKGKKFFNTEEEAKAAIQSAKKYFNNLDRSTTHTCGSIGVTVQGDKSAANAMRIVKSRIRVRLITEWEVVEEEG